MRVLHVVWSGAFAGVERYIARLAVEQAHAGDEVVVVGGDPERMVCSLAGVARHLPGGGAQHVAAAVTSLGPNADIVHVHMTAAEVAVAALHLLPRRRPRVVSTRHFAQRRGSGRARAVTAWLAGSAVDAQIAISHFVAERIEGASTIIHPGVDVRPDARPAAGRTAEILVLQRLEQEKSTDVALRAFAASGLAGQGWQLIVAGVGAQRANLGELGEQLGISSAVTFLGLRDDVWALMDRAALMFASAPAEPFGLSVLEAMAAGLPVVAAGGGGHLETLPTTGTRTTCTPGDVGGAAELLASLAADPDRRDALARAGQERQRALFTTRVQQRRTREVYEAVSRR